MTNLLSDSWKTMDSYELRLLLDEHVPEIKWVQQHYFAKLGEVVIDQLSPPDSEKLEELEPEEYFANVGYDGKGLRVPADLDNSICLYLNLNEKNRAKFDRAELADKSRSLLSGTPRMNG